MLNHDNPHRRNHWTLTEGACEMISLFHHHPRFVLKSLQIRRMFKHWKSNKGQNRSKLAMPQYLSCFSPVNHLLLSCQKNPNQPTKKPQTKTKSAQLLLWYDHKKAPKLKPTDFQKRKEEESAHKNRRIC